MKSKKSKPATKPFEEWDFNELVDYASGHILTSLIKGEFRSSVFDMLNAAIRWQND